MRRCVTMCKQFRRLTILLSHILQAGKRFFTCFKKNFNFFEHILLQCAKSGSSTTIDSSLHYPFVELLVVVVTVAFSRCLIISG
jgi:hypothetical protein